MTKWYDANKQNLSKCIGNLRKNLANTYPKNQELTQKTKELESCYT